MWYCVVSTAAFHEKDLWKIWPVHVNNLTSLGSLVSQDHKKAVKLLYYIKCRALLCSAAWIPKWLYTCGVHMWCSELPALTSITLSVPSTPPINFQSPSDLGSQGIDEQRKGWPAGPFMIHTFLHLPLDHWSPCCFGFIWCLPSNKDVGYDVRHGNIFCGDAGIQVELAEFLFVYW